MSLHFVMETCGHFRLNSFPAPETDVKVYVYYDSLLVKHQYERLVYDSPGFLSALGGSLGLYLGLSCLGIFEWIIAAYLKLKDGGSRSSRRSGGEGSIRFDKATNTTTDVETI